MNVKEFLKKNIYSINSSTQSITDYENGNVVSVKAWGEFALEKYMWFLEYAKKLEKRNVPNGGSYIYTCPGGVNEMLTIAGVWYGIADAYLNKKTIKKRLSELK